VIAYFFTRVEDVAKLDNDQTFASMTIIQLRSCDCARIDSFGGTIGGCREGNDGCRAAGGGDQGGGRWRVGRNDG
jgi:hypothetical protein